MTDQRDFDLNVKDTLLRQYFVTIFLEDFDELRYSILRAPDYVHQIIGHITNAQEAVYSFVNVGVYPANQELMKNFCDISTLRQRMMNEDQISIDYQSIKLNWCTMSWSAVSRNEQGEVTQVLCAVSGIDAQKQASLRMQQQIKTQLEEITELHAKLLEHQKVVEEAREEALAANDAKTSFLFNMSHDIRTPMNAVIGFTNLLRKYQDDPTRREDYLNKIETSSNVLLSIINNVLEMARIERGTVAFDEKAWHMKLLFEPLYIMFKETMMKKGITLTNDIRVRHPYVFCDATKIREIFSNLLSNAYKYTNPGGSVNLLVEELPCDREGYCTIRAVVSDTGIGMSEEFLPHVFEEFTRENNTTDNKIEGTGLGMPIVKRLVELQGGTISVESKLGEGTKFYVTISHKIAQPDDFVEYDGVEVDPQLFQGKRLLLAEDNELNAEIAMEILKEAGFVIDHAENGNVCVEMLQQAADNYYSAILMDIQMPHLNGYEATKKIREMHDKAKSNIPIIAMTANAFEEDRRQARESGMNGHISKPININELMQSLARVME